MKLGIVVVYAATEDCSRLLELHLERIARHASVPYAIYGCAPRLSPQDRALVASRPEVRLTELPSTQLRGSEEHSYYLEQLIEIAIGDGATHVVTLHVDSFPVRDGWDAELISGLSESCVFTSLEGINTACLLFSRAFYDQHRPSLLVSHEETASEDYQRYIAAQAPKLHSGIGYGFLAWKKGFGWHVLRETTAAGKPRWAGIHGDAIFHLTGAMRLAAPPAATESRALRALGNERLEQILRVVRMILPERIRLAIRARFRAPLEAVIDDSRVRREAEQMVDARALLFDDPESYIAGLRGKP